MSLQFISLIFSAILSSSLIASLINVITTHRQQKNGNVIAIEKQKLEILFTKIDLKIQPNLHVQDSFESFETNLKPILLEIKNTLQENPELALAFGTRFKEYLYKLINLSPNSANLPPKYLIKRFSAYYQYELKFCKKTCSLPKYSLIYPQSFEDKAYSFLRKLSDMSENFMIVLSTVAVFLALYFLIIYWLGFFK
ncbi:hypothetical protein [Lactococcus lactis]|uniref:hypothetical protein n=1 Tax=Lactococcus lactis TaxID=1358 RepID=UPI00189C0FC9|nr:hypothetical protein [Lactococcus lactis]